jgi:DNA mismatch repair protein MutL
MRDIKLMNEVLANKIAAGEIIERPLSVVKELVENSIDANANVIEIKLEESGIKYISVSDNGFGMNKMNLLMSVKRHATSKLYDEKELFKIGTLGFRGEALATMGVVSHLSITSSDDGIVGHCLKYKSENDYTIEEVGCNIGTKVEVGQLFYNTPVRYKHLSNPFYELSLIVSYISKLALCSPNVSFKLINDDKDLLTTSGNADMGAIFSSVYSLPIAKSMNRFVGVSDNFDVEIYYASPEFTKSRKSYITISLNGRIVRNYDIENTIIDSYKNFLHTNQYPIVVINIKADYHLIDVNIHPTKQQVKISLIDELKDLINKGIKANLDKLLYVPDAEIKMDTSDNYFYENKTSDKPVYSFVKEQVPIKIEDTLEHDDIVWKLPHFEYVGTLHATYLLFENESGLHLVDQHAAQERINYEKFYKLFDTKEFTFQQMLVPVTIELSMDEFNALNKKIDVLESIGIKIEEFGINTYKVVGLDKFYMRARNITDDIHNLFDLIIKQKEVDFAKIYEDVAIMMACKSSIKANQYINRGEVQSLMEQLNECDNPFTCPHGRPVIVNLSTREIEKMFKRVF